MILNAAKNSANADGHRKFLPSPNETTDTKMDADIGICHHSCRGVLVHVCGVFHWMHRERDRILQPVRAAAFVPLRSAFLTVVACSYAYIEIGE